MVGKEKSSSYKIISIIVIFYVIVFIALIIMYRNQNDSVSPENKSTPTENKSVVLENKPVCNPSWVCTNWSTCSKSGTQTRICSDDNSCGTTKGKPSISQSCTYINDRNNEQISENTPAIQLTDSLSNPTTINTLRELYDNKNPLGDNVEIKGICLKIHGASTEDFFLFTDDERVMKSLDYFSVYGAKESIIVYNNPKTPCMQNIINLTGNVVKCERDGDGRFCIKAEEIKAGESLR